MAYSHRINDSRSCGAVTVQKGQDFVKVDGQLWAVNGDPNDHGEGRLIASKTYVKINGKSIIVQGDSATPDNICPVSGGAHCAPSASGFDNLINVN